MPKKINPQVRERAVRLVTEHRAEYPSTTAAAEAVARQLGVGKESVRRWVVQAEVDGGARPGTSGEESAEIKKLKAENRRLREDNEILKAATTFLRGGTRLPQPLIMGFIDTLRSQVTRSSRSVGCCASRAARSPRGPTGPGGRAVRRPAPKATRI
jgi:transposase-like protein